MAFQITCKEIFGASKDVPEKTRQLKYQRPWNRRVSDSGHQRESKAPEKPGPKDILIYDFGLGQSPFPVPVPVVEALRLHAHEKDYLPVKGLPALKEAVAGFHHQKDNVEASADYVLVGPRSKELMFLLQLVLLWRYNCSHALLGFLCSSGSDFG